MHHKCECCGIRYAEEAIYLPGNKYVRVCLHCNTIYRRRHDDYIRFMKVYDIESKTFVDRVEYNIKYKFYEHIERFDKPVDYIQYISKCEWRRVLIRWIGRVNKLEEIDDVTTWLNELEVIDMNAKLCMNCGKDLILEEGAVNHTVLEDINNWGGLKYVRGTWCCECHDKYRHEKALLDYTCKRRGLKITTDTGHNPISVKLDQINTDRHFYRRFDLPRERVEWVISGIWKEDLKTFMNDVYIRTRLGITPCYFTKTNDEKSYLKEDVNITEAIRTHLNKFYGQENKKHISPNEIDKVLNKKGVAEMSNYKGLCGIKEVIFNPPATIVKWKDDTKTVVKCTDDIFDKEKAILMALFKKFEGPRGYRELKQVINGIYPPVAVDKHLVKCRNKGMKWVIFKSENEGIEIKAYISTHKPVFKNDKVTYSSKNNKCETYSSFASSWKDLVLYSGNDFLGKAFLITDIV